jgi:3-oxoacyl-(acyl-carrier-protein) synthase
VQFDQRRDRHTLGAAGALEAVITALALREGFVPAGVNTTQPDPALAADYVLASRAAQMRTALSNCSASAARTVRWCSAAPTTRARTAGSRHDAQRIHRRYRLGRPGLNDWPHAAAVLAGHAPYASARTVLPPPAGLPPAERRRTRPSRVALAAGLEAAAASGRDAATLATVFSASGGDGQNCHAICETLAGDDRQLSPTRFHNSVHNAPAGYWSIATRAMATSNVLCAHDGSFAAGLLESLCQVAVDACRAC